MPTTGKSPTAKELPNAYALKLSNEQALLYKVVTSIWPTASANELADKAAFEELVRLSGSDAVSSKSLALLRLYLCTLPGYSLHGAEDEARAHHRQIATFLRSDDFKRAAAGPSASAKTTKERFSIRTRWSLCQTISSNWRLVANVIVLLMYGDIMIDVVRNIFGSHTLDPLELLRAGFVAIAVSISARCAKHAGDVAGYKLALLDGPTPALPIRHSMELVGLAVLGLAGSLLAPLMWESSWVEWFLYLTSAAAMITAAGAVGPRSAKSF